MSVRIMHSADHHIGIEFRNQPELRDRLKQERLDALRRIVTEANARTCDFLVVAGDLFENINVPQRLVREVCDILRSFTGEVLVVPGNHDYYEGADSRLWNFFKDASVGSNIHLLMRHEPETFHADGRDVIFYPCYCPSKHGQDHVIGWVADMPKAADALHIGIAHGNVEGLGRDDEGNYFNMRPEDLRSAGVHCWLLGHIHAPFPEPGYVGRDLFFMPGTHTPEHVKRTTEGYAWFIDIGDAEAIRFERYRSGGIRFLRMEKQLHSLADIAALSAALMHPEQGITVLDLIVTGRLSNDEIEELTSLEAELKSRFLHLSITAKIIKRIDAGQIAAEFPDRTYPQRLLSRLADNPEDMEALQLAYDIIKSKKP